MWYSWYDNFFQCLDSLFLPSSFKSALSKESTGQHHISKLTTVEPIREADFCLGTEIHWWQQLYLNEVSLEQNVTDLYTQPFTLTDFGRCIRTSCHFLLLQQKRKSHVRKVLHANTHKQVFSFSGSFNFWSSFLLRKALMGTSITKLIKRGDGVTKWTWEWRRCQSRLSMDLPTQSSEEV